MEVSRSQLTERLKETAPSRPERYCKADDEWLLTMIRELTAQRPTYGYRRITALLNAELRRLGKSTINHKRTYRIMKGNALLLQRHTGRPNRTHDGQIMTLTSDTRWCSDVFSIQCWNAERVHVVFALDTCDREVIRYACSTIGVEGQLVRDLMVESIEKRFGGVARLERPIQWLSDNGPCFTANETVEVGRMLGFEVCTTPAYSPESNGMAEAFVKTFKRDYVWFGDLSTARRVMEQLPGWFDDYNENAPHKGLGMLSPRQFRRQRTTALAC